MLPLPNLPPDLTPKLTTSQPPSKNSVLKPLNLLNRMNIQSNLKDLANDGGFFKTECYEEVKQSEKSEEKPKFSPIFKPTTFGKGFSCPHCKVYTRKSRFKVIKHVQKKHFPKYEFKCFYCKESYDDKKYLRLHIKCSHPEKLKAVLAKINIGTAELRDLGVSPKILPCEEVEPVPSGDLLLIGAPPGIQTIHRP